MSHFYGVLQGGRGEATRCGTKKSGLRLTAASWKGAIEVTLDHNELTGKDTFSVWQKKWHGKGTNGSEPLAEGTIGEPVKKENGDGEILRSLKAVLAHAEDMLCDELKTDDLTDYPWVMRAREVIKNAATAMHTNPENVNAELLDALKECHKYMTTPTIEHTSRDAHAIAEKAEAAIKKAEG